jgi:hypothetical protein
MRKSNVKFRLSLLLLLFVAGSAAIPSALDPVRVAPHMYDVAFENDKVRILTATIRNGETPPLHAHPDRVIVYLNPCAYRTNSVNRFGRLPRPMAALLPASSSSAAFWRLN